MHIDAPTSDLAVKVSRQRTWLPFGFASEVIIEGIVKKFRLPEIIDASLSIFWPRLGAELVDLKGCDAARGQLFPSANNELMLIRGVVPLENAQNEGFSLNVVTPFKAFNGSHHVIHAVESRLVGELLRGVPIEKLGRVFPLRIQEFRFGIERFKSRRMFSMLGFVPTVCDGFNLEARDQKIRLTIFCDLQARPDLELFEGSWIGAAIEQLSRVIFGTSWAEQAKIKSIEIN